MIFFLPGSGGFAANAVAGDKRADFGKAIVATNLRIGGAAADGLRFSVAVAQWRVEGNMQCFFFHAFSSIGRKLNNLFR